jgi:hypothetical protein
MRLLLASWRQALLALAMVMVVAVHSAASDTKPLFSADLTEYLCDLQSQQINNDPPAGVDFLSENEVVVYTVCHIEATLSARDLVAVTDPNHLRAVIFDIRTGAVIQHFDWPVRGRNSFLRVTHNGSLLAKLDNLLQILNSDGTPVKGLRIPKISDSDQTLVSLSPATDAVAVILSSDTADKKTVNGVAVLDSRGLQPLAQWHETGDWWNLSTSSALRLHQELELKPGSYTLRLGVIDRGSQKIVTVDDPLTVRENEKAAKQD